MERIAILLIFLLSVAGCSSESMGTGSLPSEGPDVAVERFYEYISEARLRGGDGAISLREAYKLISTDKSRVSEAKFMEIIKRYPSGFKADVIKTEIDGTHAVVTIAYKKPSMFGSEYAIHTPVPLDVDEATNTWKIDFTGESDDQDIASLRKECDVC